MYFNGVRSCAGHVQHEIPFLLESFESYLMTTGEPGSMEPPSFIGTVQLKTPHILSLVEYTSPVDSSAPVPPNTYSLLPDRIIECIAR